MNLFVVRFLVEVKPAARRHGVADEAIRHAVDNAIAVEDAGEDPDRWLVIGPDPAGHLLEVVVLGHRGRPRLGDPCDANEREVPEVVEVTKEPRSDGANSRVVTDAEIEALSVEAEAGYDVDELIARRGRRGRPALGSAAARVESVRLDPELSEQLAGRAKQDRTTTSEVIREALRRYLHAS